MDVSRIEAISPRQIDWRKLTANQIVKYENLGVEVPSQYLQWAKDFLNDVNSAQKDEITYEMANASDSEQNTVTKDEVSIPVMDNVSEPPIEGNSSVEQKSAAEQKHEDMQKSGAGLREQAIEFTKDSKYATAAVTDSAATIEKAKYNSESEIQSLEDDMQDILAMAQATKADLKSEINAINTNNSNKSTFAKIDKLQKQLEQYGYDGQNEISDSETDFNVYKSIINNQSSLIFNASDFGVETVSIGQELLRSIGHNFFDVYDYVIGRHAIMEGDNSISKSEEVKNLQDVAIAANDDNISKAQSYKNEVREATGVSAVEASKNNISLADNNSAQDKTLSNTAAITETDKAASANLEQILQSKIRKGENLNT